MSKMRILALASVAILLVVTLTSCSSSGIISKRHAMQAVRAFEQNPGLKFNEVRLSGNPKNRWEKEFEYMLHSRGPGRDWRVDATTGEVLSASFSNSQDQQPKSHPLTEEQCRKTALVVARETYKGFDSMNMRLAKSDNNGLGWDFEWHQVLPWGAVSDNKVTVSIDPRSGSVSSYLATHRSDPKLLTPPPHILTQAQAWKIVRDFEHKKNLEFKTSEFRDTLWDSDSAWSRRIEYEFRREENYKMQWWYINAVTGEITAVFHSENAPNNMSSETPRGPYTEDHCRKVAIEYARLIYPRFDDMNMTLVPDHRRWNDHNWEYRFNQVLPTGARTPSFVNVEVNPITGKVEFYMSIRTPNCVMAPPKLTLKEALKKAGAAAHIRSDVSCDWSNLSSDPEGVYWNIGIGRGGRLMYDVRVDAMTGDVKWVYQAM